MIVLMAIKFITLTGPDQQLVEVNPAEIVALRPPRAREHFAPGTHCLVSTADGKFIVVKETCKEVQTRLGAD